MESEGFEPDASLLVPDFTISVQGSSFINSLFSDSLIFLHMSISAVGDANKLKEKAKEGQ